MPETPSRRAVLVTRPEPGAAETAARLSGMGLAPVLAPMLTVAHAPPLAAIPAAPQAVLVTSANAIPALPLAWRDRPILTVGDATAARAQAAGFMQVQSAGADAQALARLTQQFCRPESGALLLASGRGQGLPLARALRAHGFTVLRRVAYTTCPAADLPEHAATALLALRVDTALFFSPATARHCMALLQRRRMPISHMTALAISEAAALPLRHLPWRDIRVASHPNQDALLALLA